MVFKRTVTPVSRDPAQHDLDADFELSTLPIATFKKEKRGILVDLCATLSRSLTASETERL